LPCTTPGVICLRHGGFRRGRVIGPNLVDTIVNVTHLYAHIVYAELPPITEDAAICAETMANFTTDLVERDRSLYMAFAENRNRRGRSDNRLWKCRFGLHKLAWQRGKRQPRHTRKDCQRDCFR